METRLERLYSPEKVSTPPLNVSPAASCEAHSMHPMTSEQVSQAHFSDRSMTKKQVEAKILSDRLFQIQAVTDADFYGSFTTHLDGFGLEHVSLLRACSVNPDFSNGFRFRALATMLPTRKAKIIKDAEELFVDPTAILTYSVCRPQIVKSDPVPISGPRAVFPSEEPSTSVNWPSELGERWFVGPSRTLKSKAPPTPLPSVSGNEMHPDIRAPIYDLDDRNTMRKLASYKKRVPTVLPKEQRDKLLKQARDRKRERFDPLNYFQGEFEAQMNITVTHELPSDVKELLTRITNGMGSVLTEATDKIPNAFDKITHLSNDLQKGLKDTVFSAMDGAMKAITKMLWVIPLLGASFYAISIAPTVSFRDMSIGLSLLLSVILPGGLWDMIKDYWPKTASTGVQAQFGFQPDTLAHILTLCLTYMTIGKGDVTNMSRDFMRSMGSYSRSVSGWKDLSVFMIGLIESFINFVREHFDADKIAIHHSGEKMVDDWCSRVMEVVNASQTGGDLMTPDNVRLLMALRNEGTGLTNTFRIDRTVSPILHKYLGYLDDICKVCAAAMHMAKGGRPPPVVLALVGKAGVGKTSLTKLVTSCVMSRLVSRERCLELKKNFDSEVFQKGSTEYWNGYCGQTCIVVDDFAQSVPVAGGENDYIDLIRMHSSWAYPLNFADLENKGKNFFCSKFILLTTNNKCIDSCQTVIMAPEAIVRRMDYSYEVQVSPEFAVNGKMDFKKVMDYSELHGDVPYHAWKLYKHTFGVGSDAVTDYSQLYDLRVIIDEIADRIISNNDHYEANNRMVSTAVDAAYAKKEKQDLLQKMSEIAINARQTQVQAQMFNFSFKKGQQSFNSAHCRRPQSLFNKMSSLHVQLCTEFHSLRKRFLQILSSPIVQLCCCAGVVGLVMATLYAAVKKVTKWFFPQNVTKALHKATLAKSNVPHECLAQMLNSARPSDFDVIVEDGGSFTYSKQFTSETIRKIYERMVGPMKAQSNVPEPRFVRTVVTGNRVVQSDLQAQADIYGSDIAEVAVNNQFQFKLIDGTCENVLGQILFIRDTVAACPAHFDGELKGFLNDGTISQSAEVVFTNVINNKYAFKYTLEEFLEFERACNMEDDLMLIKFPRHVRAQRDISKFFLTDSDLNTMKKARIRLDTVEGSNRFILRTRHMAAVRNDRVTVKAEHQTYTLAVGFQYLGYTKYGDCGGLVSLEEAKEKMCRRIIGIHVAGDPSLGLGYCAIMTINKVEKLLKRLGAIEDTMFVSQIGTPVSYAPIEGSFLGLSLLSHGHNLNPISCITKTKLHSQWGECKRVPVPLRPFKREGTKINPMVNAITPYSGPVLTYAYDDTKRAAFHAFSKFKGVSVDETRQLYSFEEACAGIAGTDINGIPRNTSPGYPYVLNGITNKKTFFGMDEEYSFTSPECVALREAVTLCLEKAAVGIRSPHVFVDFLKDELRSELKASLGLARLISSAPLVYTVAFRMMFLAFTSAVQKTRIRNGIAVGINVYTEWDYLYKNMISKGEHCVAGDFKQFDSSEQPDIHWAILDEINAWYDDGPINALIRQVLWMEVVHSRHLGGVDGKGELIYQWNKSLPSGHPATSIINSFYNLTIFNMIWTDIMGVHMASQFWVLVYICVYGDDNILNIHPDYVDKFNQSSITAAMTERGMSYTVEDKSSEVSNTRTIFEISFLKRCFRKEPLTSRVVGPQELDSILHIPYWSKNKTNIEEITLANVEYTYLELSLHGDEIWNQWAPQIRNAVKIIMDTDPKQYFTRKEYCKLSLVQTNFWPA